MMKQLTKVRCIKFTSLLLLMGLTIAFVIPIYARHKVVENRHHAEEALESLAYRMNEYYSLQGTYRLVSPDKLLLHEIDKNPGYHLKITRHQSGHFTISAVPVGFQKRQDTQCGTLSLTDSNKRYITGSRTVAQCWFN